ncbi:MAG: hypothetical protein ACLRYE_03080 [Gemmiger formicilis]
MAQLLRQRAYRDALKQAVNGDLTPSDALTEFATALADKAGWAH